MNYPAPTILKESDFKPEAQYIFVPQYKDETTITFKQRIARRGAGLSVKLKITNTSSDTQKVSISSDNYTSGNFGNSARISITCEEDFLFAEFLSRINSKEIRILRIRQEVITGSTQFPEIRFSKTDASGISSIRVLHFLQSPFQQQVNICDMELPTGHYIGGVGNELYFSLPRQSELFLELFLEERIPSGIFTGFDVFDSIDEYGFEAGEIITDPDGYQIIIGGGGSGSLFSRLSSERAQTRAARKAARYDVKIENRARRLEKIKQDQETARIENMRLEEYRASLRSN